MLMELSRLELLEPLRSADLRIGVKRFSQARLAEPEFGVPTMSSHSKKEIWLRRLTWLLAIIALIQTVVYLGTPFLPVSNGTLAVARKCLIPPKADADFDFLATNAIWRGKKMKVLLGHANLANYNRELVNWQLDDKMYRDYVLSPVITGKADEQLN
jgi:hypothetical protein